LPWRGAVGLHIGILEHLFDLEKVPHSADAAKHRAIAHRNQDLDTLPHPARNLFLMIVGHRPGENANVGALLRRVLEIRNG